MGDGESLVNEGVECSAGIAFEKSTSEDVEADEAMRINKANGVGDSTHLPN